jgi:guanylate kinase
MGRIITFLTPDEFKEKIINHEFIEWEEVYEGNYYGTLKSEIDRIWNEGKNVIFDVDVKGGLKLKEYFGEARLAIFVKVPNMEILEQRLRDRGTESQDSNYPEDCSRPSLKCRFKMSLMWC